jgi:PKD repeat protein
LPTGLSFNTANGRITGTPTVVEAANVTITATNAGGTDSQTLVITIVAPSVVPVITTSTLTFTIGTALTAITGQLAATGSPTSWATVPPGAIPPPAGLTFNTTTGQLTGTPTGPAALTNVTFTATNADGTSAQKVIAITVEAVVSPAYYGLLGQNNTQPTWVPNLGQPTEAVILALPVAGGADGTAGPAAVPNPAVGNQWIVPNVPGHFGYCFAYPDTLPAASELWSFAASANLLSGATPLVPITVVVNGVNYRVYFQRMMVPYAGYLAQGMRLTI